MLPLAIILSVAAMALLIIATLQRRKAGIPSGRVIFSDTKGWGKIERPLYDSELRLTGRPDYLVRKGKCVIPVEVKSGQNLRSAAEWHIYQLAAYCLLVEHEYKVRPQYGIINYQNRNYAVDFTKHLEQAARASIQTMQKRTSEVQINRSHHDRWRCAHCGYRSICDQALRI